MFRVDDLFLDVMAKVVGIAGMGVYVSLCRHVDADQECWPSARLIAEELGITTRTVIRAIKKLEASNVVAVERTKDTRTREASNVYTLLSREVWIRPGDKNDQVTKTTSAGDKNDREQVTPGQRKDTQGKDTQEGYAATAEAVTAKAVEKKADENDPMTLEEFMGWCDKSPHRHLHLVSAWADAVRPDLTTKGQWRAFIKRNLRAAKELVPFTDRQIQGAFAKIRAAKSEGWMKKYTLETIIKFLV